jgi:hypothetical protein
MKVILEGHNGSYASPDSLLGCPPRPLKGSDIVRPMDELIVVLQGHPEHLGDDYGWQRVSEFTDDVHLPFALNGI